MRFEGALISALPEGAGVRV